MLHRSQHEMNTQVMCSHLHEALAVRTLDYWCYQPRVGGHRKRDVDAVQLHSLLLRSIPPRICARDLGQGQGHGTQDDVVHGDLHRTGMRFSPIWTVLR